MTTYVLPAALEAVFAGANPPPAVLAAVLPAVCEVLEADRCFLQLRNPQTRFYKILCWRLRPEFPDLSSDWAPEQEWERDDPMFAAALRAQPPIFVEDVERADPAVLNADFERNSFGHRALVHAHLCHKGQLWGILQPCIFGHPRVWSEFDRFVIAELVERLTPIAVQQVQAAGV